MYSTKNVRGEHLLWLTPILYIWLTSINAPIQSFIIFNDGDFYLVNFFSALLIILAIISIPYFMHRYLRKYDARSIIISWVHIVPTLLLILSIITIYAYAPPIERSWKNSVLSNPNFLRWMNFNDAAITLLAVLILVQLIYIFYGLILINQLRAEQSDMEDLDQEIYTYDDHAVMINPAYKYTWIPNPAEPSN
ncbi:MAG: hypothetical protein WCR66_03295 [Bacteroidota bacterium]